MESRPLDSSILSPEPLKYSQAEKGRGKLAAQPTFTTYRPSQALVISTAGNVLSQSFGKVTLSESSPSKSLCFSAVGVVWASITTPEHGFFTREKNLTTAVQKPNKERSGRPVSEEILLPWMLAAHSGADLSGRPYVNQTPLGR